MITQKKRQEKGTSSSLDIILILLTSNSNNLTVDWNYDLSIYRLSTSRNDRESIIVITGLEIK